MQYRVGKTHCQGHQDPSKRVPIFLGTHEANVKMVPIGSVPISRLRTVRAISAYMVLYGYFPVVAKVIATGELHGRYALFKLAI